MNGKELMLVLGGAIVLGGGAALAGLSLARSDAPTTPTVDTAAMDARMESIERSQARTAKSLERLSGTVDRLAQQVHQANVNATKANQAAEKAVAASTDGAGPGHGGMRFLGGPESLKDLSPEQRAAAEAKMAELKERFGGLAAGGMGPGVHVLNGEDLPEGVKDILTGLEDGILNGSGMNLPEAATSALGGMLKGFELRRLPEAERWQKAREDLNLTSYQEDELKAANTALDADMKDAMVRETRDTKNGGKLTIARTDPTKMLAARKRYDERVDNALDTDQRKKWRENGYSNAFGKSPAGGGISVISSIETVTNGTKSSESGTEK